MSQPTGQPEPPGGLAALVTRDDVAQHLLGRPPHLLDEGGAGAALLAATVKGIAAEVQATTGPDPADPAVRDLAVWCISLGAAARIETSLFPEQQYGDQGRAQLLTASYLGVKAELGRLVGASATGPLSSFPAPRLTWDRPQLGGRW